MERLMSHAGNRLPRYPSCSTAAVAHKGGTLDLQENLKWPLDAERAFLSDRAARAAGQ